MIEITRYNKPIATLVPYSGPKAAAPKLGTAPASVKIIDPSWAKPLNREQLISLVEKGSY